MYVDMAEVGCESDTKDDSPREDSHPLHQLLCPLQLCQPVWGFKKERKKSEVSKLQQVIFRER